MIPGREGFARSRMSGDTVPGSGRFVVAANDAGGVTGSNTIRGNIFCDNASCGYNRMAADRHSGHNDGIRSNPAIIFYANQCGCAFLVADRYVDVSVTVIHGEDANVLRKDHVVADLHRSDDDVADADDGAASDDDVTHSVIDSRKILDDGAIADTEFAIWQDVEPRPAPDNGSFTALMYKRVHKKSDPPTRPVPGGEAGQQQVLHAGV